jgi:hypothetical protein
MLNNDYDSIFAYGHKSELFNLLEIIIDFKLSAIRMYVPDVDSTVLTIL